MTNATRQSLIDIYAILLKAGWGEMAARASDSTTAMPLEPSQQADLELEKAEPRCGSCDDFAGFRRRRPLPVSRSARRTRPGSSSRSLRLIMGLEFALRVVLGTPPLVETSSPGEPEEPHYLKP